MQLNGSTFPDRKEQVTRLMVDKPLVTADALAIGNLLEGAASMLLRDGDNLLIAHRRLFDKDESRFFVGKVIAYDAGLVKVLGHSFVRDVISGRIIEKAEIRSKIFSLTSGTLLVYQLPESVHMESFILHAEEGRLRATDGKGFLMNLADHAHAGRL